MTPQVRVLVGQMSLFVFGNLGFAALLTVVVTGLKWDFEQELGFYGKPSLFPFLLLNFFEICVTLLLHSYVNCVLLLP